MGSNCTKAFERSEARCWHILTVANPQASSLAALQLWANHRLRLSWHYCCGQSLETLNILYKHMAVGSFAYAMMGGVDPHFENKRDVTVRLTLETAGGFLF